MFVYTYLIYVNLHKYRVSKALAFYLSYLFVRQRILFAISIAYVFIYLFYIPVGCYIYRFIYLFFLNIYRGHIAIIYKFRCRLLIFNHFSTKNKLI